MISESPNRLVLHKEVMNRFTIKPEIVQADWLTN